MGLAKEGTGTHGRRQKEFAAGEHSNRFYAKNHKRNSKTFAGLATAPAKGSSKKKSIEANQRIKMVPKTDAKIWDVAKKRDVANEGRNKNQENETVAENVPALAKKCQASSPKKNQRQTTFPTTTCWNVASDAKEDQSSRERS